MSAIQSIGVFSYPIALDSMPFLLFTSKITEFVFNLIKHNIITIKYYALFNIQS